VGWISRGCFNAIVVVGVGFLVLAAVAVVLDVVEVSTGLVLYLLVLAIMLAGLWYMARAWLETRDRDQNQS